MKFRKLLCSGEAIVENCVVSIWANFITFPESISEIQGFISSWKVTAAEYRSPYLSSLKWKRDPVQSGWAFLLRIWKGNFAPGMVDALELKSLAHHVTTLLELM